MSNTPSPPHPMYTINSAGNTVIQGAAALPTCLPATAYPYTRLTYEEAHHACLSG